MYIITPYQAEILFTALEVLAEESEAALHGAGINDCQKNTNDVLAVIQMSEEIKSLQNLLSKQYNLSSKKNNAG